MKNEIPRQDRPVDVLIITATEAELDAVLSVSESETEEKSLIFRTFENKPESDAHSNREQWCRYDAPTGCVFYFRKFHGEKTGLIRIAVARSRFMGTESAAATAAALISYLEPRCLAMCGVCAGRRGETRLGDLIVAERVYNYDTGKIVSKENLSGSSFENALDKSKGNPDFGDEKKEDGTSSYEILHDITTFLLDEDLRNLINEYLGRPKQYWDHANAWERDIATSKLSDQHPHRKTWKKLDEIKNSSKAVDVDDTPNEKDVFGKRLDRLRQQKIRNWVEVDLDNYSINLSESGNQKWSDLRESGFSVDEPKVHFGVIATGSKVVANKKYFEDLTKLMRKTLGLEMEAYSIGLVAALNRIKYSLIVKGVMDHGDGAKNDSFYDYSASASALFVIGFLRKYLPPKEFEVINSLIYGEDARVVRTDRIIEVLDRIAKTPRLQNNEEERHILRIVASMSSFCIGVEGERHADHEKVRDKYRAESERFCSFVKNGNLVKAVINPHLAFEAWKEALEEKWKSTKLNYKDILLDSPPYNSLTNIVLRSINLYNFINASDENVHFIVMERLPHHNLLIIDKEVAFIGRKVLRESGFEETTIHTRREYVENEIHTFDGMFDSRIGVRYSRSRAYTEEEQKSIRDNKAKVKRNIVRIFTSIEKISKQNALRTIYDLIPEELLRS